MLLANEGSPDAEYDAIFVLDSGIGALGDLVSLHDRAYELGRSSVRHEAALRRVDSVLANNASLLNWRLRRDIADAGAPYRDSR